MSIELKYNHLEQAYPDMLLGIGALIQKGKLSGRFESVELSEEDIQQLEKAKELCELKIIELWDQRDSQRFKALCATYFDIASQLTKDATSEYYIYEQIKLIVFGYLGEHWHFVRQYLKANADDIEYMEAANDWNKRLLSLCFKALVGLVIKENWKDIDQSVQLINQLRDEQNDFESNFLDKVNEESRPYGAAELVALYHFAKSIDVLGQYLLEGRPPEPEQKIHYHLNYAREFAKSSGNISLELLFQFFEVFGAKMIQNTLWHTTGHINNWISKFNRFVSHKEDKGVFELLYPQRESIVHGQLLNPAKKAIVVNLPTSSGKTMIAEYRILQALNQFKDSGGWVAYVVPTRALVNQIFIQFNNDFREIGLSVEKASGAMELDGFERQLIDNEGDGTNFDVLVTTYEKLNLLIRQGLGTKEERPLVLTVVDEAHNIESNNRGLNLELLLATIKNDCPVANFMLMTPDISNSREIAQWLADDQGQEIHLNIHWWQPNERVIGAIEVSGSRRDYDFSLRTLHTEKGTYSVDEVIPLLKFENAPKPVSKVKSSKIKIASSLSGALLNPDEPMIVLAADPGKTYDIAEELSAQSNKDFTNYEEVQLLIKLVQTELGEDFALAEFLKRGIGIHHGGLPDEVKFLTEDLMSQGKLQALVATTTIAQGINFPVSLVLMGSYNYPYQGAMPVRDFWNLAGRVGRAGQKNMGWVGIASRNERDLTKITRYVRDASDELQSRLVSIIEDALQGGDDSWRNWFFNDERWSAILQYISHLRRQTNQLDEFLSQLEQKLNGTFGYRQLSDHQKRAFRRQIQDYAKNLSLEDAIRADKTGFSTVSIRKMIGQLGEIGLTTNDWQGKQLFSEQNQNMQSLVGIMMNTGEIYKDIRNLSQGGTPVDRASIARLISNWVNGHDINSLSQQLYPDKNIGKAIQDTTKALYKVVAHAATWGLSALQSMPNSGLDWDNMTEKEKHHMANLPAYLHYGVNTDEGVLMRKNNVPRSVANRLGQLYNASVDGEIFSQPSSSVADWIGQQNVGTWNEVRPANSQLSGDDYKKIWMKLNGIQ